MDVIALQMPFQDATFLLLRQLVKNLSQMPPNRPVDFLPSVFGDKDNMVFCSRTACAIGFRSFSLSPPCLEVGAFQGGLCYYCLTRSNLCESPRQSRGLTCDNYVRKMGLEIEHLKIDIAGDVATVSGKVNSQQEREKVVLAVGNTAGIARADDQIEFRTRRSRTPRSKT